MLDVIDVILTKYNYIIYMSLMTLGLYGMIGKSNLIKKLIGMSVFQYSIFLFYISIADVEGGIAPILVEREVTYTNPLPHVLILTAIVVAVSTLAVGLSLVIRIYREFGSVDENKILMRLKDD
ncbi:Na+/H+ antiporter subunit C [Archaeoglobales archaeon]|nr:MAG: Na+/H+ antiporter subunit C [Archaeoglobales archaeon]